MGNAPSYKKLTISTLYVWRKNIISYAIKKMAPDNSRAIFHLVLLNAYLAITSFFVATKLPALML
jgi:hypothetical protein